MFQLIVTGRIGKLQPIKEVSGTSVLNFSVATDVGFGERKQTIWLDCALWGKRAQSLEQYLSVGKEVSLLGEGGEREWKNNDGDTKKVITLRVAELAMHGGKREEAPQQQAPQRSNPIDPNDDVPF